MNKENCALKLVDEIILYYDARSKKHKKRSLFSVIIIGKALGPVCTGADNLDPRTAQPVASRYTD